MELLCPTCLPVHDSKLNHHSGLILENLLARELLATINLLEDSVNLCLSIILGIELLDTVVRKTATNLLEELMTYTQSLDYILELLNLDTRHLGQLVDIGLKVGRHLYGHRLIRSPSRQHLNLETIGCNLQVVLERINRIVCGADNLHIVVLHQATSKELRLLQLLGTDIVNLACSRRIEQLLNTKSGLELKVSPMVERVTHCIRNGLGPLLKLLPIGCILACTIALIYAIGTHCAPLVVVTLEPNLRQVVKSVI